MNTTTLTTEQKQAGFALLAIRIAAGIAFLYHGSAILFGAFGGSGLAGFAGSTHLPYFVGVLIGLAEFCGGLAMLIGLLARLGAACIFIVMLGAILMVHLPHGFDVTKGGVEYPLTQLLIALAVLVAGAGPYSLAALFGSRQAAVRKPGGLSARPPQTPPAVQP